MSPFLAVERVSAGYGLAPVLRDVSLHVDAGEVIAVLGANGAGKTTLLRTIFSLIAPTSGRIVFEGNDLGGTPAHQVVAAASRWFPRAGGCSRS